MKVESQEREKLGKILESQSIQSRILHQLLRHEKFRILKIQHPTPQSPRIVMSPPELHILTETWSPEKKTEVVAGSTEVIEKQGINEENLD